MDILVVLPVWLERNLQHFRLAAQHLSLQRLDVFDQLVVNIVFFVNVVFPYRVLHFVISHVRRGIAFQSVKMVKHFPELWASIASTKNILYLALTWLNGNVWRVCANLPQLYHITSDYIRIDSILSGPFPCALHMCKIFFIYYIKL